MRTVYVVIGGSGDYEDRRKWNIIAYEREADAVRHVELAAAEEKRIKEWLASDEGDYAQWDGRCPRNPYNPDHEVSWDAGQVTFGYGEVKVDGECRKHRSPKLPAKPAPADESKEE